LYTSYTYTKSLCTAHRHYETPLLPIRYISFQSYTSLCIPHIRIQSLCAPKLFVYLTYHTAVVAVMRAYDTTRGLYGMSCPRTFISHATCVCGYIYMYTIQQAIYVCGYIYMYTIQQPRYLCVCAGACVCVCVSVSECVCVCVCACVCVSVSNIRVIIHT